MLAPESARHYCSPQELQKDLDESADLLLVDVRTPEAYRARHIPQAVNVCVYEIAFMDNLAERVSGKSRRLVLYGEGEGYVAPEAALQKLLEAGYESVELLEGGLQAWPGKTEGEGEPDRPVLPAGACSLNTETSRLRWIGRNLSNQHDGTIALKEGRLTMDEDGHPVRGRVVVDMTRMTCNDLKDSPMAKVLIGHLSNQDFFLVDQYPTAEIELNAFTSLDYAIPGRPNYRASGTLTVRGVEQAIELDAMLAPGDEQWVFQCEFDFDRTAHGAIYGSARFFERLGMHLVNDLVYIQTMLFFDPHHS